MLPPEQMDWYVYREPPRRTLAADPQTSIPNPINLIQKIFDIAVDTPVTTWRNFIERQHEKHKFYYYHQKFCRIPDLTECLRGDYVCIYEAEMQWRRDQRVDYEIVKIIQDRLTACTMREGESHFENCKGGMKHYKQVVKAYQSRYGDLGFHGNAWTCLLKQKHRMIAERKAAKAQVSH